MKRGAGREASTLGVFSQIALVGVLLFVVIWQVGAGIGTDTSDPIANHTPFVTTDDVNLRAGPGLEHDVLRVVPVKASVTVTGEPHNGFLPVAFDGTAAWMSADYLAPEGSVLAGTSGDLPVAQLEPVDESPSRFVQDVSAAEVDSVEQAPEPPEPKPTEVPVVDAPPADVSAGILATTTGPEAAADVPEAHGERWIEVDRATATVTLHEGDRVVARFDALIGKDPSRDGYYATAVGTFSVYVKEPALVETPFAPGVFLTDFVGFDPARSNGFHSPVRDEDGNVVDTGGTSTLGCVRLGEDEARFLFDFAFIGMRVEVHD